MYSIRKKLSIILIICTSVAIIFIALFVNFTVNNKFNKYMVEIQNKKYDRIVESFQEIYKKEGVLTKNSGSEMQHEAFMGNYCLTLLDKDKKVIWGMDPKDITSASHINAMMTKNAGVYMSKTFDIKVKGVMVGYVSIGQYSSVLLSEEDLNFKTSINKSIVASSIITLIIAILISLYLSKQFSKPIKEVANMSVNLSRGEFDTRLKVKGNILELENLRESINTLAEKLKHQDMLRKRLVSDISHEIRTPLNILQNNLEAMIDGIFPVTSEGLIALNDEVIRFGRLLNNLNVLKSVESESIILKMEEVNIDEIVTAVCKDFEVVAKDKDINLSCIIEPNMDYGMLGDKDKLKQVFINLLSNAFKFTNNRGDVWVNIYGDEHKIIVEVIDNGIGIKKEDLEFIFERLYRGDKSRHETEGNGIGLTIVKKILQLHSASIDVESENGVGTTFKVYFKK